MRLSSRGIFTMPTMIQGFGKDWIGECDYIGRSYIATEWVVFAAIPVVPLRSLRISYGGEHENWGPMHTRTTYVVYGTTQLHRWQVARTYAFTLLTLLFLGLTLELLSGWNAVALFVAPMSVPLSLT